MPALESRTTFLAAKLCLKCRNLWTNRAFCLWVRNFEFCAALGSNWLILMIPSSGKMVSLQTRHILSVKNKNQIKTCPRVLKDYKKIGLAGRRSLLSSDHYIFIGLRERSLRLKRHCWFQIMFLMIYRQKSTKPNLEGCLVLVVSYQESDDFQCLACFSQMCEKHENVDFTPCF